MFRHQGKSRTFEHNLHLATVLSCVAGIVNVTGFLAFKQLTTNVTGHFAFFIRDVANLDFWVASSYFLYIFSFLFGSFSSSFLIEMFRESKKLNVFVLPTIIEVTILVIVAMIGEISDADYPHLIVSLLLFAMGLQNSFVTKISNAVVRTTHLTGLFTDLGIEISQLLFPKSHPKRRKIKARIKLRIYIICFFFIGGILAGFIYSKGTLDALFLAAAILVISLFYDDMRFGLIESKRMLRKRKQKIKSSRMYKYLWNKKGTPSKP